MRVTRALAPLLVASTAGAETRVVAMTDPADASALQVALAGRGTEITTGATPDGALRLDRAASAQRATRASQAVAGVWIEREPGTAEVCVVSADGRLFRHAPLPVDAGSPRVFAAIAASLLDELTMPEGVDVRVDVSLTPVAVAAPPPRAIAIAAPGMAPEIVPSSRPSRPQIEIGPMISPATVGIELEVTKPVSDRVRIGAMASANTFVAKPGELYGGAAEVRYVQAAIDAGVFGGFAHGNGNTSPVIGLRLGHTWQGERYGAALSVCPLVAFSGGLEPGVWASLKWEIPL